MHKVPRKGSSFNTVYKICLMLKSTCLLFVVNRFIVREHVATLQALCKVTLMLGKQIFKEEFDNFFV